MINMQFSPATNQHELTAVGIKQLTGCDKPVILEIGANDGVDTERFLDTMPGCTVHCFECDPRAIARWKKRVTSPRAILHEVALAESAGIRKFYQSDGDPPGEVWVGVYGGELGGWDKSGSLKPFDKHKETSQWMGCGDTVINVPCITLDEWAAKHYPTGPIDFAWVDVQGAEDLVLMGGRETLKRIRFWYCECHHQPYYKGQATLRDFERLLSDFDLVAMYPADNFLFQNTCPT